MFGTTPRGTDTSEEANAEAQRRHALDRSSVEAAGFASAAPTEAIAQEGLRFLPSYASNPDDVTGQWNAVLLGP